MRHMDDGVYPTLLDEYDGRILPFYVRYSFDRDSIFLESLFSLFAQHGHILMGESP